ncbi:hypothetical protein [Rhizobium brockwellii]|uniref:hypothetical protein n=1 Tax=Rhizobium brockwellii TaxID=3019932 RepID=UPI00293DBD6E|nr:hypothetical protein [Rhizobium brockwellii]MDV4158514.1 hypothetical protein [Rhizobium brockwellii]
MANAMAHAGIIAFMPASTCVRITGAVRPLEQFQQKCAAVLRPELRENKEIEHFRDSKKNGSALW